MTDVDTSRISPTAHYTGYVWCVNDLSFDGLRTRLGRTLYTSLLPFNAFYRTATKHADLNMTLVARHRIIDHLLDEAIAAGVVGQVVEIAGGLSARGARFSQRYPELVYVEGDLPDMVATKSGLLDAAGLRGPKHHVVEINALVDEGPNSVFAAADRLLDKSKGTAIITEGLTGYFSTEDIEGMWRRFAACLEQFPHGVYYTDIMLGGGAPQSARWFKKLLEWFARGETYLHYSGSEECVARLRNAGFGNAELHHPRGFGHVGVPSPEREHLVRLIEAVR